MNSFNKLDLDLIANIARYHRKAHPSPKHLAFSQLVPRNQQVVRKLSAILRVADALDYKHDQSVKTLNCAMNKSRSLIIAGSSAVALKDQVQWAHKKGELMQEVFNVNLSVERAKINTAR
jgi:exopolyphosphatase / guanosine-5'-triphosphate,3'-diphosphate pyrophosphatase